MDYSIFDKPEILYFLFHPRPSFFASSSKKSAEDRLIPVEEDIVISSRLHNADKSGPTILFFHGNGEIVEDYDDIGAEYLSIGVNFLPVDYRGYGNSTGKPTVQAMMDDSHAILKYVKEWLSTGGYSGPLFVMGRSLGSASAFELAANHEDEIDGIIIESGFAYVIPLLKLLGANIEKLGIKNEDITDNIDKVKSFKKPLLIIHAEQDHIIPFSDGQALFEASPSPVKKLLKIPKADHNTLLYYGLKEYMKAVKEMVFS